MNADVMTVILRYIIFFIILTMSFAVSDVTSFNWSSMVAVWPWPGLGLC